MLFGDVGRAAVGDSKRNPHLVSGRLKRTIRKNSTPNQEAAERDSRSSFVIPPLPWRQSMHIKDLLLERGSIILSLPDASEENQTESDDHNKFIGETVGETIALNSQWMQRAARFLIFYAIGVGIFMKVENWDFIDATWFVAQTISTVGYGNITPKTTTGRMFDIFYMLIGILITFSVLGDITRTVVKNMRRNYVLPPRLNKLQLIVRHVLNLIMWIFIMCCVFLFGAVVFSLNEGWKFSDALYFSVVTCASIGYGDIVPKKTTSIWFNIFFILAGVSTTALAFEKVASFKRHLDCAELDQIVNDIELSPELLNAIDRTGRQRVSRAEYVLHMLQLAGKLDASDITPWVKRFDEYDADRDGFLTKSDWLSFQNKISIIAGNDATNEDDTRVNANPNNESISETTRTDKFGMAPRQRSILMQVADEARDVLLETLKLKRSSTTAVEPPVEVVVSPLRTARVLKRASTFSSERSIRLTDDVELSVIRSGGETAQT
jgi:hypothetical protein